MNDAISISMRTRKIFVDISFILGQIVERYLR